MTQDTYNIFSLIISVFGMLFTLVGLYAVYIQIKKVNASTWSSTHSMLCNQSFELLKMLNDTPGSYDYFYKCKPLLPDDENRIPVLYVTEALVNFLEHLILQKDNLLVKQWKVWERFINTTFDSSVVVTDFIKNNRDWYSPDLLQLAEAFVTANINECGSNNR